MGYKLVVSTVKPGVTDDIVTAAKSAGARGATIIPGRGAGTVEAKTFFGLTLEEQTDVVLFLLDDELVEAVVKAISEAGEFDKPGTGIAFSLPVDQVTGLGAPLDPGS